MRIQRIAGFPHAVVFLFLFLARVPSSSLLLVLSALRFTRTLKVWLVFCKSHHRLHPWTRNCSPFSTIRRLGCVSFTERKNSRGFNSKKIEKNRFPFILEGREVLVIELALLCSLEALGNACCAFRLQREVLVVQDPGRPISSALCDSTVLVLQDQERFLFRRNRGREEQERSIDSRKCRGQGLPRSLSWRDSFNGDVNGEGVIRDDRGWTPFHVAARMGDLEEVQRCWTKALRSSHLLGCKGSRHYPLAPDIYRWTFALDEHASRARCQHRSLY